MPLQSKADNNVPFLPGRSRFNLVNLTPTWCYHEMLAGATLQGVAPKKQTISAEETDPSVSAGLARYTNLTEGGLFVLQAQAKKALLVLAIDNPAGATVKILNGADPSKFRTAPATFPFRVGPGEVIQATGGSTGGKIGVLYEIDSL